MRSRTINRFLLILLAVFCFSAFTAPGKAEDRVLPAKVYRDKMKGGWIGQIIGVVWGAPTEFKWNDKIIPEEKVPKWKTGFINNAFGQDDLYVEMTFLRTLEQYGLNCDIRQAGIDFANSEYALWCANRAGRNNLRSGIAPPDSGHPKFNRCPNDIDYQIEADYAGLISPGLPNRVIALGDKFGRLMNYSDGIYGGIFMGGMYAEAFFTDDLQKVIAAGLASIPEKSQYAEMVRDMVKWHHENPGDWQKTWNLACEKYRKNPEYQKCSNGGIDVKINGVCVLLGLLYGDKDIEKTTIISMRGGFDSDCNPSSAVGVLCTMIGFDKIPERFTNGLNLEKKFSYTSYNIPGLLNVCEKLARSIIIAEHGKIEKDANGNEIFMIPRQKAAPLPLELSWAPGPVANSRFSSSEMDQIRFLFYGINAIQKGIDKFFPGWTISQCGSDMDPGIREHEGNANTLITHPWDKETPCLLTRSYRVPDKGKAVLHLTVGAHGKKYNWELIVRVFGSEQFRAVIGAGGAFDKPWNDINIDLSKYAGQTVQIELANRANGWHCEAGYWKTIEFINK
ncbi:MAG: ADP-ribosylglycohydrolase family protein [Planctomycetia bacterium]|nr:ADP-ribosylglycohydrolase family protein [Planctomycetia bacterium]